MLEFDDDKSGTIEKAEFLKFGPWLGSMQKLFAKYEGEIGREKTKNLDTSTKLINRLRKKSEQINSPKLSDQFQVLAQTADRAGKAKTTNVRFGKEGSFVDKYEAFNEMTKAYKNGGMGANNGEGFLETAVGDLLTRQIDEFSETAKGHIISFMCEAILNGSLTPDTTEWLMSYVYAVEARIIGLLGICVFLTTIIIGLAGTIFGFFFSFLTCFKIKSIISIGLQSFLLLGVSLTSFPACVIMLFDPVAAIFGFIATLTNKLVANSSVHVALIFFGRRDRLWTGEYHRLCCGLFDWFP
eukprot:UN27373